MPKSKIDIHKKVTDDIVAALEAGAAPWQKAWSTSGFGGLPTRVTGERYRGINVLILWLQGRSAPTWMTYKQAQELGGNVRKGEKGTGITFFKPLKVTDKVTEEEKTIPLIKTYTVFNVEQIDGLPARFYPTPAEKLNGDSRTDEVEAYIAGTQATVNHGGDRAFYRPSTDEVHMPEFDQFESAEAYYGTMLHELVHWTSHKSRLDRDLGKKFGDTGYAREELVAEIGAAFLTATLGIENTVREDHASYVANWLKVLKDDKKAVFKAAAAAQVAADYLDGLQEEKALAA